MLIPKPVADILIELVDMDYIHHVNPKGNGCTSKNYLLWVNLHSMGRMFEVKWSGGGTEMDSWGDEEVIHATEEPYMAEYYEFISNKFPHAKDYQLIALQDIIVEKTYSVDDYYGGSVTEHEKFVHFETLAQTIHETFFLENKNLIDFDSVLKEHSEFVTELDKEDYKKVILARTLEQKLEIKPHTSIKRKL